jgi:hypothetical protein
MKLHALKPRRAVTGVLKHFSTKLSINVKVLGNAIASAGVLGSEKLLEAVNASSLSVEGNGFTLIDNTGALKLGEISTPKAEPVTATS